MMNDECGERIVKPPRGKPRGIPTARKRDGMAELSEATNPPSPRLRRVSLPFTAVATCSAEVAPATQVESHGALWRRRVEMLSQDDLLQCVFGQ